MPLTRPTLLGATLLSFRSSIGWNSKGSEFTAQLINDPTNGDNFTPVTIGTPVYFSLGAFTFNGVLSKYTSDQSRQGDPVFSIVVKDPTHILDFCKIILSDYKLSVSGIFNLFNVYGYWESTGYGNAHVNDSGMPWQLIQSSITNICNSSPSAFGGPISYQGQTYSIDLSALPPLPQYFRVNGNARGISILDFIQICCDAANYDFIITLVSTTITLVTVPRLNSYPLGTLSTAINTTFAGNVIRSSYGLEERPETTSQFLIGGNYENLYELVPAYTNTNPSGGNYTTFAPISGIYPFWGFDAAGQIMYGRQNSNSRYANFYASSPTNVPNYQIYSYQVNEYNLYVPELASIIGSTYWLTNDLELQVLLGLGQNKDSLSSWMRYLRIANYSLFHLIALGDINPVTQPPPGVGVTPNNTVASTIATLLGIQAANIGALATTGWWRLRLVYQSLFKYASEYYGKKYANYIPGVSVVVDSDTGVITPSHEVSNGGWVDVTDTSNSLLNLPGYASDLFQTQDGRYIPYAKFNANNADLSRINGSNSLINGNDLFVKAKLDNTIYFDNYGFAYVVADVQPIYDYPNATVGLSGVVGAMYAATGIYIENSPGTITLQGQQILSALQRNNAQGSNPLIIHPAPRQPSGFEIPLKSNILTYGPWWAQGNTGRLIYEQDSSLVPWNYGGFTNLNLAGIAKAEQAVSTVNVIETGYIEVVGEPAYNIGTVLASGGPNITDITIDFGERGVTTTYRFETYVPKFGQLSKYNTDLLRRNQTAGIRYINEAKARNRLNSLNNLAQVEANTTFNMIGQLFDAINIRSPQNALVGQMVQSTGIGAIYPIVSTSTYKEALGFIPQNPDDYNSATVSTLDSVIGPYSVNTPDDVDSLMPDLVEPAGIWDNPDIITAATLSPWIQSPNGWTSRIYTRGIDEYEQMNDDFNIGLDQSDTTKRVFGLKGPLVLTAWGFGLDGQVTPTGVNYLLDYSQWNSGPIDFLWDQYRGVWTSHDILNCVANEDIPVGSGGSVTIMVDGHEGYTLNAINKGQNQIDEGDTNNIGYIATDNSWYFLTGGSQAQSYKVLVDDNDNSPDYLYNKLQEGINIKLDVINPGGDETVEINSLLKIIETSGAPGYIGGSGELIFNDFATEKSLYLFNGYTWYKFCPCGEPYTPFLVPPTTNNGLLLSGSGYPVNIYKAGDGVGGLLLSGDSYPFNIQSSGQKFGIGNILMQGAGVPYNIQQYPPKDVGNLLMTGSGYGFNIISGSGGGGGITYTAIGTNSALSTSTLSINNVTLAVGDILFVLVGTSSSSNPPVTWGSNNVITQDNEYSTANAILCCLQVTAGYAGTHDIVVNNGSPVDTLMIASKATGITGQFDTFSHGNGTLSSPNSGATGMTTLSSELAVSTFMMIGAGGTGTPSNGYSAGQNVSLTDGATIYTLIELYKILSSTTTTDAAVTGITPASWQGLVNTFE